jgi:SEC-C motif-containing protein
MGIKLGRALNPDNSSCPCGSIRSYQHCCGVWHEGVPAIDAPSLMRSRYTAYVLCNEAYLFDTWHPSTRPRHISFDQQQRWLGLKVIEAKLTGDRAAEVEFIARYRIGGATATRLHERSRFVREAGRWLYVDGDILE